MASIHDPSITNGTGTTANGTTANSSTLASLAADKDRLESELSALSDVLKSHGVTMQTGLTTLDGFPRADIDVPQIRTTRARIIRLRNDHRALMAKIEAALTAHFAAQSRDPEPEPGVVQGATAELQRDALAPSTFARVASVSDGSPAASAGLRAGDRVVEFGDADWLNHDGLRRVAGLVAQSEGKSVAVVVVRDGGVVRLSLTPRRWEGRGMLGCHLVPE